MSRCVLSAAHMHAAETLYHGDSTLWRRRTRERYSHRRAVIMWSFIGSWKRSRSAPTRPTLAPRRVHHVLPRPSTLTTGWAPKARRRQSRSSRGAACRVHTPTGMPARGGRQSSRASMSRSSETYGAVRFSRSGERIQKKPWSYSIVTASTATSTAQVTERQNAFSRARRRAGLAHAGRTGCSRATDAPTGTRRQRLQQETCVGRRLGELERRAKSRYFPKVTKIDRT